MSLEGVGKMIARDIMTAINPNYYNETHSTIVAPVTSISNNSTTSAGIKRKVYRPECGKGPWLVLKSLHHLGNSGSRQDISIACMNHLSINLSDDVYKNAIKTLREKGLIDTNKSSVSLTLMGIEVSSSLADNHDTDRNIKGNDMKEPINFSFAQYTVSSPLLSPDKRRVCLQLSPCWIDDCHDDSQRDTFLQNTFQNLEENMKDLSINCNDDDDVIDLNSNDDNSDCGDKENLPLAARLMQRLGRQQASNSNTVNRVSMIDLTQNTPVKVIDGSKVTNKNASTNTITNKSSSDSTSSNAISIGEVDDWEVTLLVDRREKDHDLIIGTLRGFGISCDVQTLALGDFLWVAKKNSASSSSSDNAVVLDCIVERKTPSDLASSIIDGRYKEQRLRLTKCGLKTKLYILEGLSLVLSKYNPSTHMSAATLKNSMISTQVEHSMQVIRTRGIDHTITFLSKMHQIVKKNFITDNNDRSENKKEYVKYQVFHENNSKKKVKVVGDLFAYQLKQIPGCSSATAKIIQHRYGTIRNLIEELKIRGYSRVLEEVSLLEKSKQMKIGPKLAEKICKMFS